MRCVVRVRKVGRWRELIIQRAESGKMREDADGLADGRGRSVGLLIDSEHWGKTFRRARETELRQVF